jgi:hypothetical protein
LASVSTNSGAYLARLLKAWRYSFRLLLPWVSFMNSVCLIAIRLGGIKCPLKTSVNWSQTTSTFAGKVVLWWFH